MVTFLHTTNHQRKKEAYTKWWRIGVNFFHSFFSIGFIFLYSSVLSIQGSPTSLSFTLFHQMILFHMRWFHSEHPLTVNLHTLTLQIHHHTGYVWAYRISAYSRFFQRQSCCYKPLGGTVVLEPDNSHFFLYYKFLLS